MSHYNRRQFLIGAAGLVAGATLGTRFDSAWARPKGANDLIRVGIVGLRNRGNSFLIARSKAAANVQIVALCEPDPDILTQRLGELATDGITADGYYDYRDMIARNDIDAVLLASPTHHHCLHTVWAMQTGKHVFCEKPVCHNVIEGTYMAGHAGYYSKILQIGLQQRADPAILAAVAYIQGGALGPIQSIHGWWFSGRSSIGNVTPYTPTKAPNSDFFDQYQGPASVNPIGRSDVHNGWHFMWDTGNGDLLNLGVHLHDTAHMFANFNDTPTRVRCMGNRYKFNDVGQTPNIQFTVMDYPDFPIIIENRGLSSSNYLGRSSGLRVQCQNGYFVGFRGGGTVYDNSDNPITSFSGGDQGASIVDNFFDAIRSGDPNDLVAPIGVTEPANTACLLGNASYRMGTSALKADIQTAMNGFGDSDNRLLDIFSHLEGSPHNINLATSQLLLGPWLTFDNPSKLVTQVDGSAASGPVDTANDLLRDADRAAADTAYRTPDYVLPDSTLPVELSEFAVS